MDLSSDDEIAAMRAFNRFYTRQMGLLDESLLKSTFSLAESRVIYELAHRDGFIAMPCDQHLRRRADCRFGLFAVRSGSSRQARLPVRAIIKQTFN